MEAYSQQVLWHGQLMQCNMIHIYKPTSTETEALEFGIPFTLAPSKFLQPSSLQNPSKFSSRSLSFFNYFAMIAALGSPNFHHVDHTSSDSEGGNANAHSNLFNLNLNFKEFKLALPLTAIGSQAKSPPTLLELPPSDSSSTFTSPSFTTTMASPRPKKTSNPGLNSSVPNIAATAGTPPQALPNLLNKVVTTSTGIYQQSVLLRLRLQRVPAIAPYLAFSHSGPRASRDVVQQLWEMFSLGKPLCILFNLQDIPTELRISEYVDDYLDPDPLRKERQRASALFIMGVNNLKRAGYWEKDAPLFSISELIGDAMDTNGFVKVVATVLYLLDNLPPMVWSESTDSLSVNALPSHEPAPAAPTSRADVERSNLVRELIETERKYCQDLEIMQVCVSSWISAPRANALWDSRMPSFCARGILSIQTPFITFSQPSENSLISNENFSFIWRLPLNIPLRSKTGVVASHSTNPNSPFMMHTLPIMAMH